MPVLSTPLAGVDLTEVVAGTGTSSDEGNQFALGTTVMTADGTTYMYVHAAGTIDQYDFVSIDENFEATALADAGGAAGHILGAAQIAIADNGFAWVAVDGTNIKGNALASCAADTMDLWTSGTAGHVDDATSGGAISIRGVVLVTAVATNACSREIIMRNAHFNA